MSELFDFVPVDVEGGAEIDSKKCNVCDAVFETSAKKRSHKWEVHGGGTEPAVCKHGCGFAGVKKSVSDHERICSSNSHECDLCHVTLKNRKSFLAHVKTAGHSKAERQAAKQQRRSEVTVIASLSSQLARVVPTMSLGLSVPAVVSGAARSQYVGFDNSFGTSNGAGAGASATVPDAGLGSAHATAMDDQYAFDNDFGAGGFEPAPESDYFCGEEHAAVGTGAEIGNGADGGVASAGVVDRHGDDDDNDNDAHGKRPVHRRRRGAPSPPLAPPPQQWQPIPPLPFAAGQDLSEIPDYVSTALTTVFSVPPAGGRGRLARDGRGGILQVISSATFHRQFWESHGTNRATANAARLYPRAIAGLHAISSFVRAIAAKVAVSEAGVLDVEGDMSHLQSLNNCEIAVRILAALVRGSRLAKLPPSVFFALDAHQRVDKLLEKLGMSKTAAQTGLNMVAAMSTWFLSCVHHLQGAGALAAHARELSYSDLKAFCDELKSAVESLRRPITQFRTAVKRAHREQVADVLRLRTEEYTEQLYGALGDLTHCLIAESDALSKLFRGLGPRAHTNDDVQHMWDLVAVTLMGVGAPSARKGLLMGSNKGVGHSFYFASGKAVFQAIKSNSAKSGVFRNEEGDFVLSVSPHAGQKGHSIDIDSPLVLPSVAQLVFTNLLAGLRGRHVARAPVFKIDKALEQFRARNRIALPLYLDLRSVDLDSVTAKRATRNSIREQRAQLALLRDAVHANANADRADRDAPQPGAHAADAADVAIVGDDNCSSTDGDDENESVSDAVDDMEGHELDVNGAPLDPNAVPTIRLTQLVLRRLLTTLLHDMYLRHLIDETQLSCATFVNHHSPHEAYNTYNKLPVMFADYDVHGRGSRWALVEPCFTSMLVAPPMRNGVVVSRVRRLNAAVMSWHNLNEHVLTVHENLRWQAAYHSVRTRPGERVCPECGDNLSKRTDARFHACFTDRKDLIELFKMTAEE
jgi:hypothetical protein